MKAERRARLAPEAAASAESCGEVTLAGAFVRHLRESRRASRELHRILDADPYPDVEQYLDVSMREVAR